VEGCTNEHTKEDAKRAMDKSMPFKAPVLMLNKEWKALDPHERAVATLWATLGVREDTMRGIREHELV